MFYRSNDLLKYKLNVSEYGHYINKDTIEKTSWKDVHKILNQMPSEEKEVFLHNVISEWVDTIEENRDTFKALKRMIKKSKIKLNRVEREELFIFEARIFALERAIKQLDVNIKLKPKEVASIRYENAILFKDVKILKLINKGTLIVTNKRALLVNPKDPSILNQFLLSKIKRLRLENQVLKFLYNNKVYALSIYDNKVLLNILTNIINKKVKKVDNGN